MITGYCRCHGKYCSSTGAGEAKSLGEIAMIRAREKYFFTFFLKGRFKDVKDKSSKPSLGTAEALPKPAMGEAVMLACV